MLSGVWAGAPCEVCILLSSHASLCPGPCWLSSRLCVVDIPAFAEKWLENTDQEATG